MKFFKKRRQPKPSQKIDDSTELKQTISRFITVCHNGFKIQQKYIDHLLQRIDKLEKQVDRHIHGTRWSPDEP